MQTKIKRMSNNLDISANRSKLNYPLSIYVKRLFWAGGKLFFRLSPRTFFNYRNAILRIFGAKVGKHVHIYNTATITFPWNLNIGDWSAIGENALIYNLGQITIGEKVTISHKAHLCAGTHDYTNSTLPLLRPSITICNQAWVAADAFIGPNVTIGEGAIIGARAVLVKNAEPWGIYVGNPATYKKRRELK